MALTNKVFTAIHSKTGSELTKIKNVHDAGHMNRIMDNPDDDEVLTSMMYQMQKMQDELDYLRTEISANKDKKSMTLGTSGSTALAGDTNIVTIGSSTRIAFGDMVTVPAKGKTPASYSIVMTVTNGGVSKSTTLTLR